MSSFGNRKHFPEELPLSLELKERRGLIQQQRTIHSTANSGAPTLAQVVGERAAGDPLKEQEPHGESWGGADGCGRSLFVLGYSCP